MAELATPSAAAMFDASTVEKKKPEKPDEEVYKATLKTAEKNHADSMDRLNKIKGQLDIAQPKNKDTPSAKRKQELINQRAEIQKQQAGAKGGRNQVFDQIKKFEDQLKSRIAEQKVARSKVAFKSVDELDREIDRLETQVNGGMMKLVDEKKALTEVSSLRKQRKGFAGFDEAQKGIDDTKKKIKELRDTLDDPATKAMSENYNKIQAELDAIRAEQDEAYKSLNSLRDERTKAHNDQQEKYMAMKKIKDDYYNAKKAHQNFEYEARQRARERQKAEREKYDNEKKKERAEKVLEDARYPAYSDEIRRAQNLLQYFDPSATKSTTTPLLAPSKFSAEAQRTVDDSGIKGTRVVRKDEREDTYFMGTGGKKGKKGRKAAAAGESPAGTPPATTATKFSCPPSVMEDCGSMGIDPPMSQSDIPTVAEKVKEKLDFWKSDQKAQTDRNVAKAQKEIERLDSEGVDSFSAPAANGHAKKATSGVEEGGSMSNEIELMKSAVADVAADLKGAALEEKE